MTATPTTPITKELLAKIFSKNDKGMGYCMRREEFLLLEIKRLGLPENILQRFEAAGMIERKDFLMRYWKLL